MNGALCGLSPFRAYGLKEAIAMLEEEGLTNVFARHHCLAEATRRCVAAWGLDRLRRFSLIPVDLVLTPMDSAGGAVFEANVAGKSVLILNELPHHKHGYLEEFLAVFSKENAVVLLAPLWIAHEAHGRGFRAGVLNDPYPLTHEVIHQFVRKGKVLAEQMNPAVRIYQTLGY